MSPNPRRVAAVLAAAAVLAGCGAEDEPPYRTAPVGRASVSEVVEAPGTVTAKATGTVSSPAAGTVAVLRVGDGQRVEEGQELLRIDSPQARAQLRQALDADAQALASASVTLPSTDLSGQPEAAERAAAAAFAQARRSAAAIPDPDARAHALAAVDAAEAQHAAVRAQAADSVRRFEAGLASLGEALSSIGQAQRVQTRAAVALAQRTVDALVLRAPLPGVVNLTGGGAAGGGGALSGALAQVPADLQGAASSLLGGGAAPGGSAGAVVSGALAAGSPVSAGEALLSVTDVSALALTAQVDETDVLLVRPGVRARAELDAVPGSSYAATVLSVDVSPAAAGGGGVTYAVRLSLGAGTTPDGERAPAPRPGMSAVVGMEVRRADDVLAVPASAVFQDGARQAVWIDDGGRAERRTVRLGAQGEQNVQVLAGLREGQTIVVSGADSVTEGALLR